MPCYHPLTGLWYGGITEAGKKKYKIISKDSPISSLAFRKPLEAIEVPCGKCIGCRLDYSRQWADRCMLEAKQYPKNHNWMITLTYDPENITMRPGANRETGELELVGTLVSEDLTKFMKDLRRFYKYHYNHENIRFYACGEYGPQTYRPHYHLIIFNTPIKPEELEYFFTNKEGDKIYLCEKIQKIWGKGQITVGEVTWNSAAYVARYVMKKRKGKESKKYYKLLNVEPEFVRMSRKPGIAYKYFEEHKDEIYEADEIIINNKKGEAKVIKPSKYYDRLYDLDSPEAMKAIKERRKKMAEISEKNKLSKTSLDKETYLAQCEQNKIVQINKLIRNSI